eukprot:TRINITY_DN1318_c0_g1_i1.p1 TRINITY_DN1318_c0_g1~~TRINITY_DN1318_c0_g1_i1.p1  ORF type:complete len:239 (+),score=44.91 TRINITY_DN1318_c0_g1_i1:34-750(+)
MLKLFFLGILIVSLVFAELPDNFSWRKFNILSEILNEQDCSASHVISVVQTIEARSKIYNCNSNRLSIIKPLFCNYDSRACDGGLVLDSLDYLKNVGTPINCTKFDLTERKCTDGCVDNNEPVSLFHLKNYQKIQGFDAIRNELMNSGPCVACFSHYNDIDTFNGEIYSVGDDAFLKGIICMEMVGWNKVDNRYVFEFATSFGKEYGKNDGFLSIYGDDSKLSINEVYSPQVSCSDFN